MKQNHITLRLLSLLLVLSMVLLPVLMTGCSDQTDLDKDDNTNNDSEAADNNDPADAPSDEEEETTIYTANVPDDLDLGGNEFRMLVYDNSNHVWYDVDFAATEITSDLINDAAYKRMAQVEEDLNTDIVAYPSPSYGLMHMRTAVSAGDDLYDAGMVYARGAVTLAEQGYLVDLLDPALPLDIDAPWWDQGCTEGLSIADRLYMVAGDISILYRKSLRVYYFNKQVAEDKGVENLYELVENGTWTMEALARAVDLVSEDLDGDDEMTGADLYGLIYTVDTMGTGLIGAGVQIVTKDEFDTPTLSFYDENTVLAFEAITDIIYDYDHAITGNDRPQAGNIGQMFLSNQALFNNCELHNIESFRSMETNFGILPTPKLDEYQENYRSIINPVVAGMLVIPVTNALNLENTCYVLDSLGAASKNTLTPAYIDVYLQGRGARDEESRESLNIVFNNVVFDLGYIYNWGNIATFTYDLVRSRSTNFSSSYEKIATAAQKAMETTLDTSADLY